MRSWRTNQSRGHTFVGTGEGPVVAADCNATQRPFGGVAGQAEPAVIKEPGERRPALEAVVERPGGLALAGEFNPLLLQIGL